VRTCPFCYNVYTKDYALAAIITDGTVVQFEITVIECECGATWAEDEDDAEEEP